LILGQKPANHGRVLVELARGLFKTPETTEARPPQVQPQEPALRTPSRGLRLLIVEDHIDTAESLAELLKMHGYSIRMAHSFESVLQGLRRHDQRHRAA
jgi:hypothetical protein